MSETTPRRGRWLRLAVLVIAGLEAAVLLLLTLTALGTFSSSEQLSRNISQGMLSIVGLFAVPVLAALLLAALDRWLWLALALSLAAVALPILVFPNL